MGWKPVCYGASDVPIHNLRAASLMALAGAILAWSSEPIARPADTPVTGLRSGFQILLGGGSPTSPPAPLEGRNDSATGIALDGAGNLYVTGIAVTRDFPFTVRQPVSARSGDCFVMKVNASGSASGGAGYVTYIPGTLGNCAIAVDQAGNAYVAGRTQAIDFPTTGGAVQRTLNGPSDAFLARLNASGGIEYATLIGGDGEDRAASVAVDLTGVYLAGFTNSARFPVTAGAAQATPGGGADAFAAKLDLTGSTLLYATYLGGSGDDQAESIKVDGSGSLFVGGGTESPDLRTATGAFQARAAGARDAFVARLNAAGTGFTYLTYLGGSGEDSLRGLAVDGSGHVFAAGWTRSADFPTGPAFFQRMPGGGSDAFVVKLAPDGGSALFSTLLGGNGDDSAEAIALDPNAQIYVAGWTRSGNFPTWALFQARNSPGVCSFTTYDPPLPCQDTFVTKLGPLGNTLVYSTYLAGDGSDAAAALAADGQGGVYAAGMVQGRFPAALGSANGILRQAREGPREAPVAHASSAYLVKLQETLLPSSINAIVSTASYESGLAPGGLISIFGTGITNLTGLEAAGTRYLPTELAETQVRINGWPAPLYAVANVRGLEQINAQVPFNTEGPTVTVQVVNRGIPGAVVQMPFAAVQPGLFVQGDGHVVAQRAADYSLITPQNPALRGEWIVVYATGLGSVAPAVPNGFPPPAEPLSRTVIAPEIRIGGEALTPYYSGLSPGSAGLYQLNVQVPQGIEPGDAIIQLGNHRARLPVR